MERRDDTHANWMHQQSITNPIIKSKLEWSIEEGLRYIKATQTRTSEHRLFQMIRKRRVTGAPPASRGQDNAIAPTAGDDSIAAADKN
eukprot:scaffold6959_cov18-Prasinocladus_malaysianus.AAC.1